MPRPKAASSARATGCAGARSATVSCPPVTAAGTIADFGKYQRERPGPEGLGEPCGGRRHLGRKGAGRAEVAEVDDERMARRPPLRGEDARNRRGIRGVGAEPVDGFGRERDQLARVQPGGRLLDLPGLRQHRRIIAARQAQAHSSGRRFQPVSVRRSS